MDLANQTIPQLRVDKISGEEALSQFSDLLDSSFNSPPGSHFFDDFPVWDPKQKTPSVFRIGVFQQKQLLSSAAVRIAELKIEGGSSSKVALIGAVATLPDWRGHGLASSTVSLATQWAKEEGAHLALLWGSEHRLYQRLGFNLSGKQVRVPLSTFCDPRTTSKEKLNQGWNPNLFEMICTRSGGLVFDSSDRNWFEAHRNVTWYWTGDQKRPKAYVAIGRGIDLKDMVHEWGGDRQSLIQILSLIAETNPKLEILGHPDYLEKIGIPFAPSQVENLALIRILNPAWPQELIDKLWIWGLDAA